MLNTTSVRLHSTNETCWHRRCDVTFITLFIEVNLDASWFWSCLHGHYIHRCFMECWIVRQRHRQIGCGGIREYVGNCTGLLYKPDILTLPSTGESVKICMIIFVYYNIILQTEFADFVSKTLNCHTCSLCVFVYTVLGRYTMVRSTSSSKFYSSV